MKKFNDYLNETSAKAAKIIEIYHGDNFNTTELSASLMNNGNNQEGIGIYFSNKISTAESYGKNIIKIEVQNSKLIDSRTNISKIGKDKIQKLLHSLMKYDLEGTFYFISDYIEIQNPEDLTANHIDEVVKYLLKEQVRYFQINLVKVYGVENFVREWNKIVKIDGTFQKRSNDEMWYSIINDKIKVLKVLKELKELNV